MRMASNTAGNFPRLDIMFPDKWQRRFLNLAGVVSSWSRDPSTKCGAVIVRPDKTICSVGFNGFPRGVPDDEKMLDNREERLYRTIHAEANAIISAKDTSLAGYGIFIYPMMPCANCSALIIQSGITYVVYQENNDPRMRERWEDSHDRSKRMFKDSGVECWSNYGMRRKQQ